MASKTPLIAGIIDQHGEIGRQRLKARLCPRCAAVLKDKDSNIQCTLCPWSIDDGYVCYGSGEFIKFYED